MFHITRVRLRTAPFRLDRCSCLVLSTTPLTKDQLEKLDVVQRKMMRQIAGWGGCQTEDYEENFRRMKKEMRIALSYYPVKDWSECRKSRRNAILFKIRSESVPSSVRSVYCWAYSPLVRQMYPRMAYSRVGRCRYKWID